MSKLCQVATFFSIMLLLLIVVPSSAGAETVVVNGDSVNLRAGPGSDYPKTGQTSRGARLTVIQRQGSWCKVRLPGGKICWIAGWLVKAESGSGSAAAPSRAGSLTNMAEVTATAVNLRGGPGSDYPKVGQVSKGTSLTVVEHSGSWYKVRLSSGKTCWIAGWLVKVCTVPVLPPAMNKDEGEPAATALSPSEGVPAAGEPARDPFPVSRGDKLGALMDIGAEKSENGTEFVLAFCCPVNTEIQRFLDPNLLMMDVTGLPVGQLPGPESIDSDIVSMVRVGWQNQNPPVARIVFELKYAATDVYWDSVASSDKQALRLRLHTGKAYGVTGKIIVLDPGHGGRETGALGPNGLVEKDVNLEVAQLAAEELRYRGAQVTLTRETDQDVDLYARGPLANSLGADVFVSVHANANVNASENGTSTYWYAPVNDPLLGVQRTKRELLASCLQRALLNNLNRKDLGLYTANFVVLRTSSMPSALIETAFVSNPAEEQLLGAEWFRKAAAKAVVEGLEAFFTQV
ncbi:MAG: N-acetylmuramoyl-L-alanine amidase [Bacillota bacterium]